MFDKVKEQVSIKDILDYYGITETRYNTIKCPFHSDKQPSCKIYHKNNYYVCFSCGSRGDVITFMCNYENITPLEAVKKLDGIFSLHLFENPNLVPLCDKLAHKVRCLEKKYWKLFDEEIVAALTEEVTGEPNLIKNELIKLELDLEHAKQELMKCENLNIPEKKRASYC